MRIFVKILINALRIALSAAWHFLTTPSGAAVTLLSVATVTSGVMLSSQLVDYAYLDEREIKLASNLYEQFDVFSAEYQNESGEISVSGLDGKKVIAPGTSAEYTLYFRNTDEVAIDLWMTPKASLVGEMTIPLSFRMLDSERAYVLGDEETWVALADVNEAMEGQPITQTLRKGESTEYHIQWKWDFESGDDAHDTALGSQSGSIGVTMALDLKAEANLAIAENGGVWESGVGEIIVTSVSFVGLGAASASIIIALLKRRRRI